MGLRLEFTNNDEMFNYIEANKQLQQFVKPPNSKNPKDPETQYRLKNMVATAKAAGDQDQVDDQETDSGVKLIPLDQIFTDHKNFQNRETDFSADSVRRITDAIRDGSFRWSMFDPITVWRDPEDGNRFKILSGHSRTSAFIHAASDGMQAEGRDFSRIPAKIFEGTLEEAKELARNSNNLSTKETEVERANYYRDKRSTGVSPKEIRDQAQKYEGKNAGFILNLSYLNPAGKTWDSLRILSAGTESENTRTIKEIADWIGEARRKFPDLTNGHENEIYDWLLSGAFSRIKGKRDYLDRLGMAIQKATQFGVMDERLNIENRSGKSATEVEYDEKVQLARDQYNDAEKTLKEKRKEFISRGADPNQLDTYLIEYQAAVNNSLRRLNELVKLRDQVKEGAKNQMSLFGLNFPKFLNTTPLKLSDGFYEAVFRGHNVTVWGQQFNSYYGIKTTIPTKIWIEIKNGMASFCNSEHNRKALASIAGQQNQFDMIGILTGPATININGLGKIRKTDRSFLKRRFDPTPLPVPVISGTGAIVIPSDSRAITSELKLKRSKKKFADEPIRSPLDAEEVFRKIFPEDLLELQEAMYVLFLDTKLELVGYMQLSRGTINSVEVDFRILFAAAIQSMATGIIICHNHPSGNLRPSEADEQLSKKLEMAGMLLSIRLYGSYVITKDGFSEVSY